MEKLGFEIMQVHVHEIGLDLEEQFYFFQLINNVEIIHLDQITIKEFDIELIEKVLAIPNSKVKQLVLTYFNLYDLDPFLALVSMKYACNATRILLSF